MSATTRKKLIDAVYAHLKSNKSTITREELENVFVNTSKSYVDDLIKNAEGFKDIQSRIVKEVAPEDEPSKNVYKLNLGPRELDLNIEMATEGFISERAENGNAEANSLYLYLSQLQADVNKMVKEDNAKHFEVTRGDNNSIKALRFAKYAILDNGNEIEREAYKDSFIDVGTMMVKVLKTAKAPFEVGEQIAAIISDDIQTNTIQSKDNTFHDNFDSIDDLIKANPNFVEEYNVLRLEYAQDGSRKALNKLIEERDRSLQEIEDNSLLNKEDQPTYKRLKNNVERGYASIISRQIAYMYNNQMIDEYVQENGEQALLDIVKQTNSILDKTANYEHEEYKEIQEKFDKNEEVLKTEFGENFDKVKEAIDDTMNEDKIIYEAITIDEETKVSTKEILEDVQYNLEQYIEEKEAALKAAQEEEERNREEEPDDDPDEEPEGPEDDDEPKTPVIPPINFRPFIFMPKFEKHITKTKNEPSNDPKDPTEPTGPKAPKDPDDPEEPRDPKDPKDPEDPEEPTDPKDPKDPEDPEEPTDPKDPKDPEDPEEPTDPKDPKDPDDPEEPKNPKKPKDPKGKNDPEPVVIPPHGSPIVDPPNDPEKPLDPDDPEDPEEPTGEEDPNTKKEPEPVVIPPHVSPIIDPIDPVGKTKDPVEEPQTGTENEKENKDKNVEVKINIGDDDKSEPTTTIPDVEEPTTIDIETDFEPRTSRRGADYVRRKSTLDKEDIRQALKKKKADEKVAIRNDDANELLSIVESIGDAAAEKEYKRLFEEQEEMQKLQEEKVQSLYNRGMIHEEQYDAELESRRVEVGAKFREKRADIRYQINEIVENTRNEIAEFSLTGKDNRTDIINRYLARVKENVKVALEKRERTQAIKAGIKEYNNDKSLQESKKKYEEIVRKDFLNQIRKEKEDNETPSI